MSFRYIGSKTRVVDAIMKHVGLPDGGCFIDAFSGTGVVAEAAAKMGWPILVNDHLVSSAIMSLSRVISRDQVPFHLLGGYRKAVDALNQSLPRPGFIWQEYSPASSFRHGVARMYFTEENAQRIDGIRSTIAEWSAADVINDLEEKLLIADLIGAANRVANTAGTYGCFPVELATAILGMVIFGSKNNGKESAGCKDVGPAMCSKLIVGQPILSISIRPTQSANTPPTTTFSKRFPLETNRPSKVCAGFGHGGRLLPTIATKCGRARHFGDSLQRYRRGAYSSPTVTRATCRSIH